MRVLLVDRSHAWRSLEQWCFEELGIRSVVATESNATAWNLYQDQSFDILFIDVDWADPTALELIQQIRAEHSDLPIILLINEADLSRLVGGLRAGVTDYLVKPCRPAMMRDKLSRWAGCFA